MKTIWKYQIPIERRPTLELPEGAEILHVGVVREEAFLWAMVDDEQPRKERFPLAVVGTGGAPPEGEFLGTIQMMEGDLILHIFLVQRSAERSVDHRLSSLERRVGNLEGHRRES